MAPGDKRTVLIFALVFAVIAEKLPGNDPGRLLRFKGAVAAVGAAVGCRTGKGSAVVWNAPVFGEDFGCPLTHYGYHLQRYFPKPIFRNHFIINRENSDLRFCCF